MMHFLFTVPAGGTCASIDGEAALSIHFLYVINRLLLKTFAAAKLPTRMTTEQNFRGLRRLEQDECISLSP